MKTSQRGIELIKEFEVGNRPVPLDAYWDSIGSVWTIGYGHTRGVGAGNRITLQEAEVLLMEDLGWPEGQVNTLRLPLNQNQFDALVSLVFNLKRSARPLDPGKTIGDALRRGDYAAAARGFLLWNKGGGRVIPGLTRRRRAEMALFETPVDTYVSSSIASRNGPETST